MAQPTLKKGAKGDTVRQLQEALASAGFDPVGTRQGEAKALFDALAQVRPGGGERRVNRGATAVLTEEQFVQDPVAFDAYIESQLASLAGQGSARSRMMHRAAAGSLRRAAPSSPGRRGGARCPQRFRERAAERNAARAGNARAVASFSPHCLGLAMTLRSGLGRWCRRAAPGRRCRRATSPT